RDVDLDDAVPRCPTEVGAAGVDEEPVEPRLEPIRIAETGQGSPCVDERILGGVFRGRVIPDDLARGYVQRPDGPRRQLGERVMVACHRPLDRLPLDATALQSRPRPAYRV